jgi:hypothetical protein
MATWLEDVVEALSNLGGTARYVDLYDEIERVRTEPLGPNWQAAVRASIEIHSSDSKAFNGSDIFYSVDGIGKGRWGLRGYSIHTPNPSDNAQTQRVLTETYRILRDTAIARTAKLIHNSCCQICGSSIVLPNGSHYAEAHHIRPLGAPHNGPDEIGNILVLCPNHHVMLDYGVMAIDLSTLTVHTDHQINPKYISYHNKHIYIPAS